MYRESVKRVCGESLREGKTYQDVGRVGAEKLGR